MNADSLADKIASFLAPFLPYLIKGTGAPGAMFDAGSLETASALWDRIKTGIGARSGLPEALQDPDMLAYSEDIISLLIPYLKKIIKNDAKLAGEMSSMLQETGGFAEAFLNDRYCGGSGWLETLDSSNEILRRLEMIRLLRAGAHPYAIAKKYNAVTDYIYRLNERFSRNGLAGILTENDFRKYRSVNPEVIRICSFNLHGTHSDNHSRYKRIARELSSLDPEMCAFQEVISGSGIKDTSAQIAYWLTRMTGCHYRTHFVYCHLFKEKYDEGVSVCSKYPLKNLQAIDLNLELANGIRPSMERFSAACEIEVYGRRVVFASVHLDHDENREIRHAQAEKLLSEIGRLYPGEDYYCHILAGDFNDVEDSPAMNFFRENGYKDAYRVCRKTGGGTYISSKPHSRIDYIMVKGKAEIISADLILKNPELSDHIGVFAVIK